jgi:FkbM family methyltransferase
MNPPEKQAKFGEKRSTKLNEPTNRLPKKENALRSLRKNGLDVGTILDVGVQHETLELKNTFPELKHFLFEPVEEYYEFIQSNYENLDHELVRGALSDKEGEDVLSITKMGADTITHSSLDGAFGGEVAERRVIKTITLDSFLQDRNCPKPYLLKLDVDGHELPILRGAQETLKSTSCVVIEAPLCYLSERVSYLESKGFHLWDIVDLCYYYGNLHQVDLIFLSAQEKQKAPFSPWQNFDFDWEQWKELSRLI